MFTVITTHVAFFLLILGIVGLVVGSFLNVVIYRLPIMLKKNWQSECLELLEDIQGIETVKANIPKTEDFKPYNLITPASHCPKCRIPLKLWQNIPVLSYLLMQGKCANCRHKISIRYPLVEALSCAVAVIAGLEFGISFTCIAACIFGWFLITISFIDIENQFIPDILTMPLLWIGLILTAFETFITSNDAILGAIIGYIFLWIAGYLFRLFRKKEGIGLGDCKLLAATGAWVGWQLLPIVILSSSIFGLIVGASILLYKKLSHNTHIPFAPFIAIAAWIAVIWGFDATQYYFYFFGVNWPNV
jgi:leader peptidase (prepilin peptidase)/N-methyltransferase